jgi:hypothetical protein
MKGCIKMTEKQKFIDALKTTYNAIESPVLQTILNTPSYYKDKYGNHHLVGNIHICIFGGAGITEGDLGCITFAYNSKTKEKGRRNVRNNSELFKKVFVPKDADEAFKEFGAWLKQSYKIIKTWKHII